VVWSPLIRTRSMPQHQDRTHVKRSLEVSSKYSNTNATLPANTKPMQPRARRCSQGRRSQRWAPGRLHYAQKFVALLQIRQQLGVSGLPRRIWLWRAD
jgi:hypothetical protein